MAHDVRNPHIFVNGVGNKIDADQVLDNFDALWTKVDSAAWVTLANLVPKVLYGSVSGTDGSTLFTGSAGWSASRSSVGVYVVTFSPAYSVGPFASVTPFAATGAVGAIITAKTTGLIQLRTVVTTNAGAVDSNFEFIAIGAR